MRPIRPSWITKEEFYRLPFNFCDRWCEKCNLTHICKVYLEEKKDREEAIQQGKNPDSWEFVFEVVHKNLRQTFELLYKDAKKWGIDLEKIEKETSDEDFFRESDYNNQPLYKTTLKLSLKLEKLLKKLEYVPVAVNIEKIKDEIEVLSFYRTLILAKIARALSSEDREENYPQELKTYDDKTSAFIVYNSLGEISKSLINLSKQKALSASIRQKCLRLAKISLELADLLDGEFALFITKSPNEKTNSRRS